MTHPSSWSCLNPPPSRHALLVLQVVRFAAEESAKLQEKIEEMEAKKTRLDAVLEKAEKSKKSNKDLVAGRDEVDSEQAVTEAQLKEQKQQPAYFFNKHLDSGDPSHG